MSCADAIGAIFSLIALGITPMGAFAASANPASAKASTRSATPLPELLKKVEAKYAKAQTLTAKFSQVVDSALSKQKQTSSGLLMFKRPNQIRWETSAPDRSLFVSNGVTAWFYTPPFDPSDKDDRGEYRERRSSSIQNRLANALLSGSFSMARDMSIQAESPVVFTLKPKKKGADGIQKATIEVDPAEDLIRKVIIEHRGGNTTAITLSSIQLGEEVEASKFSFTPPPNTDRVDD